MFPGWLIAAGAVAVVLALLLFTRWIVGSIRGRTAAERARRNFAQAARDRAGIPKREIRRQLMRRFFRGCWRGFLAFLGLSKRAGGTAKRAWLGPSMKATAIQHRPPSGRVSKVSRRINKPV